MYVCSMYVYVFLYVYVCKCMRVPACLLTKPNLTFDFPASQCCGLVVMLVMLRAGLCEEVNNGQCSGQHGD